MKKVFFAVVILVLSCGVVWKGSIYYHKKAANSDIKSNYISPSTSPIIISNSISSEGCKVYSENKNLAAIVEYGNDSKITDLGKTGYANLNITDTNTNKVVKSIKIGANFCPFLWVGNDVYLNSPGYEGPGVISYVDLNRLIIKELNIINTGFISPDKKYYVYTSDTDNKDGLKYCTNFAENTITDSASSIRILDLESGTIDTLITDKNKIFAIAGWSSNSKEVYFTQSVPTGKVFDEICPEYKEIKDSIYTVIDIASKELHSEDK